MKKIAPDKKTTDRKTSPNIHLDEVPSSRFTNFISKFSPKVREFIEKDKCFNVYDGNKKVGDADVFWTSKDSLNIIWVEIDEKERGNGYGTALMKSIISFGKDNGAKEITLEVPGNSPDARHIYEKLGFKETHMVTEEGDYWDGLTAMRLEVQ